MRHVSVDDLFNLGDLKLTVDEQLEVVTPFQNVGYVVNSSRGCFDPKLDK